MPPRRVTDFRLGDEESNCARSAPAWSPDGRLLACGSRDKVLLVDFRRPVASSV